MKMRVPQWVALSVLTAAGVAACSDLTPVTGPLAPGAASRVVTPGSTYTVCTNTTTTTVQKSFDLGVTYGGSLATLNATGNQGVWHAPLTGSDWVKAPGDANAPFTNYGVNAPDNVFLKYTTPFTVDAGYTATITGGQSFVDNQITSITVDGTGASLGANALLDGAASVVNYAGPNPLAWSTSGTIAAGNHTIVVIARNNDDIQPTNPTAVDYCFTVTQTLIPVLADRGCSPGYWKNHTFVFGAINSSTKVSTILGPTGNATIDALLAGMSLQTALELQGNDDPAGFKGLAMVIRASVGAYLNALAFPGHFGETAAQVKADFQGLFTGVAPNKVYNSTAGGALKTKFESMQDVNGRTCTADFPNNVQD